MTDILDYALTSVADVKETLGITGSSQDNLIRRKINQATLNIEAYCNLSRDHHFKQSTYTNEEYDGTGVDQLSLRMRPVSSITSFQYRNTVDNQSDWTDIEAEDYFADLSAGVIDLLSSQSRNWNAYRVTYIAGYETIPSDLAEACVTLACYLVENSTTGTAVKRKREGGREIEYFDVSAGGGDSLINSLGLDDALSRYINYTVQDDK